MAATTKPQAAPMPAKLTAESLHQHVIESAKTMPPGRPGNLTAEQEAKLKELWARLFELFGIYTPKPGTAAATKEAPASPVSAKKSSGGFFGRKSEPSTPTDGNDKHGLSKAYQSALAELKPEELESEFYKMTKQDDPDATVLRYLRARKWDVQAALVMLVSAIYWRARELKVDDILMAQGEAGALRDAADNTDPNRKKEGEDFIAQFRMGKSFLHGHDKTGRPCNYIRVRLHKGGEQTVSSIEKFTIMLIETTRLMITPPIDTATIVFDMTGFSLANMDYTPVKFMIKCFEANYPESLGGIVIYKAPWIFQGIWKIIKGWLDPVVAAKVHFADKIDQLAEYIDRDKIMKECDGNEDYVYQYIEPKDGENEKMADTATRDKILAERKALTKEYDQATIQWIEGANNGPQRSKLSFDLHLNYFKLDPYVRARSLYDRMGLINTHNQFGWDEAAVKAAYV